MPSIAENKDYWNDNYDWSEQGREWSEAWGTAEDQWFGTIYRRIFTLLPAEAILEIAPGRGRWTAFLLGHCRKLTGIDLSIRAVEVCQDQFGERYPNSSFSVGDGTTLGSVPDASIDFVFSFDSLVHVEIDCLTSYAKEIHRVLKPGGHAFLHHSNLAEYVQDGKLTVAHLGWRGLSVSAETAREAFSTAGLQTVTQEKNKWVFDSAYCDCFSLLSKAKGEAEGPTTNVFYNEQFGEELKTSRQLSANYTSVLRARIGAAATTVSSSKNEPARPVELLTGGPQVVDTKPAPNPLPVTFVHQGETRFLRFAIEQAKVAGFDPILVGDQVVARDVDDGLITCSFYKFDELGDRARKFARDSYRHVSVNHEAYELFCYQRWFVLYDLMAQKKGAMFYADSDVLLYEGFPKPLFDAIVGSSAMMNSAWFNYFRDSHGLMAFLDFITTTYANPDRLDRISRQYSTRGQPHVSDMILLFEFASSHPEFCTDSVTWGELFGLDGSVTMSSLHRTVDGVKDIEFRDGVPMVERLDGGRSRFFTLHFQGAAKPLMQLLNAIEPERLAKLPDFSETIAGYANSGEYQGVVALYKKYHQSMGSRSTRMRAAV